MTQCVRFIMSSILGAHGLSVWGPQISVLGSLVGDGDNSTDHSHRPSSDSVKCAQQTPQVGSWRGSCIFWNLLRNCLLGRRKNMAQRHIPTMTNSHHGWNLSAIRLLVLEVMLWTGRQWRLSRCRSSTLLLSSSLGHPTQSWEPGQCHKNKSIDLKKSSLNFVFSGTPSTGFSS